MSDTKSIYLSYTKKVSNTLPLIDFAIDSKNPCLLPNERFTKKADNHYPLENDLDFPSNCSLTVIEKFDNLLNRDSRYLNLGVQTNQYLIQSQSGVFDTLQALPGFSELFPNATQTKKQLSLFLYARPITPWRL